MLALLSTCLKKKQKPEYFSGVKKAFALSLLYPLKSAWPRRIRNRKNYNANTLV
jgi:predicted transcriptional regulator